MRFASAHMAVLLWIIPLGALFFTLTFSARKKMLEKFAGRGILNELTENFDLKKIKFRNYLTISALFLIVLALMRPQWGYEWIEVKRMGLDIIVALDVSNSMLAEDVRPNRLERSKLAIKDLVENLRGDRIGLIAFSGTAFLKCPLTLDYNGFLMSLADVDTLSIPVGGTSLSAAITEAVRAFEGEEADERVLIIVSDGEDHEGGIERAVAAANARGIRIFSLGVGTLEGEMIPMGREGFLRDADGNVVRTRLVESTLKDIALATGGMYVRASGARFGLDEMYKEKISKLTRGELRSEMQKRYNDRFQFPLALALIILVIEQFIGDKSKRKEE